ncbi:MAG TPA: hypothetical protein VJS43_13145 [Candidatus Acidoferrales bacterium]|nr:hypothetical protein [Candidatus Acidoferrales bacterium]
MKNLIRAAALVICLSVPVVAAPQNRILAQKLVNDAHARHPEASEIGIVTTGSKGCTTIASTDKSDIGEKCEADDSEPIRTGKPYVGKEGKNFDVTLPLHDESGKTVGSVGIELAPRSGQTQADVVKRAQDIAKEMEAAIPSKASLSQPF